MKKFIFLLSVIFVFNSKSVFAFEHNSAGVIEMSVGHEHSLLLRKDGSLLGMGNSMNGALGPNLIGYGNTIPTLMFKFNDIISIAAGDGYSLILRKDGTVWEFGSGGSRYSIYEEHTPTQVKGLNDIVKIVSGFHINYAIKSDGSVWYWLPKWDKNSPNSGKVKSIDGISDAKDISSNGTHALLLKNDNTVWQWSEYIKIRENNWSKIVLLDEFEPVQVFLEDGVTPLSNIIKISSRYFGWSVALKEDGSLWEWQYHPFKDEYSKVKQVPGIKNLGYLSNIIDISSGTQYTMALIDTGDVVIWGNTFPSIYNTFSVYPTYVTNQHNYPNTQIIRNVKQIATRYDHALLLHEDGSITALGNNTFGQLGNGNHGKSYRNGFRFKEGFASKVLLEKFYEIDKKYNNYKEWDMHKDSLQNNWRIKLNKEIDLDSITEDNIYLTNVKDEKLPVIFRLEDDNTIYIRFKDLTQSEFAGNVYYLVITDDVKTIDGEKLKSPVRMMISGYLNIWTN